MDEVRRILNTPEFQEIPSPARRVVRYKKLQNERNYPDLSLSLTCSIAGTNLNKVRRRMQSEKDGTLPGKKGRHRTLTQAERRELVDHIRELAEEGKCPTYADLIEFTTEQRKRRLGFRARRPLSKETIRIILKEEGLLRSRAITSYQEKAMASRATIQQMFINISMMMKLFKYPNSLIFNMDESWVTTKDKVSKEYVIHPSDLPPVAHQPTGRQHITLIGCISKSGEALPDVYIVPSKLSGSKKKIDYCLEDMKFYSNETGFINGDILARWIHEVLGPYVTYKRKNQYQRALLIVDAHTTRHNPMVLNALRCYGIDMIILPAHVTSKYQPLDVVIYGIFKEELLKDVKKNPDGGLYTTLFSARNAWRIATTPRRIRSAWMRSKLFTKSWQAVVNTHPIGTTPIEPSTTSNVIYPCFPLTVNRFVSIP